MFPLAVLATIALSGLRRRLEALIVAASVVTGTGVVYFIKLAVDRDRPTLWETEWSCGSSFQSGHTLAFATAVVVCIRRLWPPWHRIALWTAFSWIGPVAFSRLVLGVHWPSDGLEAAFIRACLPPPCRRAHTRSPSHSSEAERPILVTETLDGTSSLVRSWFSGFRPGLEFDAAGLNRRSNFRRVWLLPHPGQPTGPAKRAKGNPGCP